MTGNGETSTFGSEIVAMQIAIRLIKGLRYKLRLMGVPIKGSCNVLCDNESVVKNCSRIESILHEKHSSIAYHMSRWAVTAGEVSVGWINSAFNLADSFTKRLSKQVRENLFWCWTY